MNPDWKAKKLWLELKESLPELETESDKKTWLRFCKLVDDGLFGAKSTDIDVVKHINDRVKSQLSKTKHLPSQKPVHTTRKLVLLTEYYKTNNEVRNKEIQESLKRNIDNLNIDKIIVFTSDKGDIPTNLTSSDIEIVHTNTTRLKYTDIYNWCMQQQSDNIYLLANVDCHFENDVKLIKHLEYTEPILYTMTRYERYYDEEPTLGRDIFVGKQPEHYFDKIHDVSHDRYKQYAFLEPWSADAFVFDGQFLNKIKTGKVDTDITMGTESCEVILQYRLHCAGVILKNIGFNGHIKCMHNHKTQYRSKENWPGVLANNTTPGIYPSSSNSRPFDKSIHGCHRLISEKNWMDSDSYWHKYSDFVVTDLKSVLTTQKQPTSNQPAYTNKLSIVMLCTKQEIETGQFDKCLSNYLENIETRFTFDLIIYFDNKICNDMYIHLKEVEKYRCINQVIVKCHNISPEDNIYIRPWNNEKTPEKTPELGLSSGPNILFYRSMNHIQTQDYENFLVLECDTQPLSTNWYDILHEYIIEPGQEWLITSSSYKGTDPEHVDSWHCKYLNGVALYRNNSKAHRLFDKSEKFIKHMVSGGHMKRFLNYDAAHNHFIKTYEPWNQNQLVDSELFVNMSLEYDDNIDIENVKNIYPKCVILHNKQYTNALT